MFVLLLQQLKSGFAESIISLNSMVAYVSYYFI